MYRTIPVIVVILAASAGAALAQPRPITPLPPQPVWDSRGWVRIGERTVDGRDDHDRIAIGRHEGRFRKLTMVVEDSDLELVDFRIVFGDNTEYHPRLSHVFREGQRTRVIDLPPGEAEIRSIDIRYRNLPGGGHARVQVWGWRTGNAAPLPPPAPPAPPAPPHVPPPAPRPGQHSWDTRGWTLLGARQINGRYDHDRIAIGRHEGRFRKLTMVVEDSDLELLDLRIEFDDRTEYHPRLSHFFRQGQRTRVIDLPPSEHVIRSIDLRYRNTPGSGPASVEIWGLRDAAPPPVRRSWDTRGWTLLGARQINGRHDHDRIEIGRHEGRFRKLTMAVEDSDLELVDFRIAFDDGTEYHPRLSYRFREGQRTRAIDLPPGEHAIRFVDIRYKNTRGGGPASIELWGLRGGAVVPPPPAAWDPRGWTLLGERTVDGRFDRDRIDVRRHEGRLRKLMVVVEDSDLELIDLSIKFGRGAPWHPAVSQFFRDGQRTRAIDLPGDHRIIKHIDFRYRNLPGGGRARVQVWAK